MGAVVGSLALNGLLLLGLSARAVSPSPARPERTKTVDFELEAMPEPKAPEPEPVELEPDPAPSSQATPLAAPPRAPLLAAAPSAPGIGSLAPPTEGLPAPEARPAPAARVAEADEVDVPPKVLRERLPRYPPALEAQGVEGWVRLRVLIDASGQVRQVIVAASAPEGAFDAAAKAAMERWRFSPAQNGGEAVPVWAQKTLRFSLGSGR